jgi:hypothetical protein
MNLMTTSPFSPSPGTIATALFQKQPVLQTSPPCVNNLREIDAAVNQWALEHGKHAGDPVTLDEIKPYVIKIDRQGKFPSCPDGGTYSVTVVGAVPTCSLGKDSIMRSIHDYFFGNGIDSRGHRLPP